MVGALFGELLLSIFGGLLLVLSLIFPSKSQVKKPAPAAPQPRRITPQVPQQAASAEAPSAVPAPQYFHPAPAVATAAYSAALFPSTMFPSLSPTPYQGQPPAKEEGAKQPDELLEVGLILAVLKMAFG